MRSKNRFSKQCLHDGLKGMVILKMAAMYQMRSKNRFSKRCLHDGLEGMVILKMAAMYR
jgi:hypothetical protein